jgi:MoaA/NifB/PqqE/SkfB family radical SAM enzyme
MRDFYRRAYQSFNLRLRVWGGGRWADHCRPTSIALLLTSLCNARCVHGDIWKNKGKEAFPTIEQWKTTLTDLRRWLGPVHVFFTGGEALLQPFAIEAVRHASSLALAVESLTHGYWKDQSRIEQLALANPWRHRRGVVEILN